MATRFGAIVTAALKGRPNEAIEYTEVEAMAFDPEDERAVVKLKMAYAAVHPADCNVLEGTYMYKVKCFPSKPVGYEGCGIVAALSKGAVALGSLKEGDLVIPRIGGNPRAYEENTGGCWSTEIVAPVDGLVKVPDGLSAQQAALVGGNSATAYCMLKHGGVKLPAGSWVIQNLGSSAVGLAVCACAKRMGIKTCSIVRREEVVSDVKAAGGDIVVVVRHDRLDRSLPATEVQKKYDAEIGVGAEAVKAAMAEVDADAKFALAIDGVGGASAGVLLKSLAPGGELMTYGNMSREPIQVGGGQLIFKSVKVGGFILWHLFPGAPKALSAQELDEMNKFNLETAKTVKTPVACVYPLSEVKDAVQHAFSEGRVGKVLLKCNEDVE